MGLFDIIGYCVIKALYASEAIWTRLFTWAIPLSDGASGHFVQLKRPVCGVGGGFPANPRISDTAASMAAVLAKPTKCAGQGSGPREEIRDQGAERLKFPFLFGAEMPRPLCVGIHPGGKAIQVLAVNPRFVMRFRAGQQSPEAAVGRSAFPGKGAIAFQSEFAEVPVSEGQEVLPRRTRGQIQGAGKRIAGTRFMAADAMLVQHGLNELIESERPGTFRTRCEERGPPPEREWGCTHWGCDIPVLMAAHTSK